MKYFYDRKADSLYLTFAERSYGDSLEAAPGVVLDFDKSGGLIGIDLEHASDIIDVTDLALHEQPSRADVASTQLDGRGLKQAREALGFSQVDLGRKLSVSANTVARWERGELKIEHPLMLQLALSALANVHTQPEAARTAQATRKKKTAVSRGSVRKTAAGSLLASDKREAAHERGHRPRKKNTRAN